MLTSLRNVEICDWDAGNGWRGTYNGPIEDNKPHGDGIFRGDNDGDEYKGHFRAGRFDGKGEAVFGYLDDYHGMWKNGQHHGYGVRTFECGSANYRGQWQNGMMHGHGMYNYADGQVKCGEWEENELKTALPREQVEVMLKIASEEAAAAHVARIVDNDAGLFDTLKSPKYSSASRGTLSGMSRVLGSSTPSTRSPSSASPSSTPRNFVRR